MSVAEFRQTPAREFIFCVDRELTPPLSGYLQDYVKSGCTAESADYRLMPLAASSLQFNQSGCHCLTDCMFELQSKYEQFIPDDWGGRMDRGWRDAGVIGFNIEEGISLDIEEISRTACHEDWAEPRLACLDWERLLVHAVLDFARHCGAVRVTLPTELAKLAAQTGFELDEAQNRFVAML